MNMKLAKKAMAPVLMIAALAAVSNTCIMEDRIVDVVLNDSTCASWYENHSSANYANPVPIRLGEQVDRILEDNDLSRADISSAHLVRMTYGVTEFSHSHDWEVTGTVTVRREDVPDGPFVLFSYDGVSVADALGENLPVVLNEDGVGVVNRALADFIGGENPTLIFTVNNSGVEPAPSPTDLLQFSWQACVYIQVVAPLDIEVPDPF